CREGGRNPINKALDDTLAAMRSAVSENGKLLAVRKGAERLHCFGDAATDARDLISESAINVHALNPAVVQQMFEQGVDSAIRRRAHRGNGSAKKATQEEFEVLPDEKPVPEIAPFETFDAGDWEDVPLEPRRWIVHHRIPAGKPGIMSGDGGSGKTKLMLQL